MIKQEMLKDGDTISLDCDYRLKLAKNTANSNRGDCCECHFVSASLCSGNHRRCPSGYHLKKVPISQRAILQSVSSNVVKPNYYQQFGIDANEIIKFVLDHPANKDKSRWEIACMHSELKYRLRAGFKTDSFAEDMEKAMNYHKQRK